VGSTLLCHPYTSERGVYLYRVTLCEEAIGSAKP
jgi:hypothetical protein